MYFCQQMQSPNQYFFLQVHIILKLFCTFWRSVCALASYVNGNDELVVLWEFHLRTDKHLEHNTPKNNNYRKEMKIEFRSLTLQIPRDNRIAKKEQEKITKYQTLHIGLSLENLEQCLKVLRNTSSAPEYNVAWNTGIYICSSQGLSQNTELQNTIYQSNI